MMVIHSVFGALELMHYRSLVFSLILSPTIDSVSLINTANVKLKFLPQLIFVLIDHGGGLKAACADRDLCHIGCECM